MAGELSDPTDWIVKAAKRWASARRTVLALPVQSPDWLTRLNDLSEAEDALRTAVEDHTA